MRKSALAVAVVLGAGIAVLGAAPAQAKPMHRTPCYTTQPVVPRFAPQPPAPKHCGKNTKPQYRWLTAWI